uniref:Mitochondrial-processing peptidase subunit alpha n=1 Tax=Culex quinquefasciatus TaxID=7176 RepID=A0A1S4J4F8_CULQU
MLSLPLGTAQAFARRIFLNKCYTSVRPYVSGPVEGGRASVPDGPTVNVPSKEVVTALPPLSQPVPDLGPVQYARPGDQSNVTQVTRLSNGLRVASENRFGQFCTVGVVIDSGPRYELAYPSGISHFLEKLAFQSTASFGEKDVIFKELEKHGGICDCQSSRDTFVYAASADSRGVEAVTRILADVVLRPRLANEEVEFARQTVKFELETLGMRPEQEPILMDMIHAAGFRDNTLGLPKLCPLKTADQIDRNMLLTYLRHHHTPDRMVLAGVGVPHDELVRLAERFFVEGSATWESEKIHAKNPTGVDTSIAQYTGGSKLEECAIPVYAAVGLPELAHVVIGLKGCSHQDKDFIAACVLNIMMGGGGSFSAGGPGKGMYTRLYTNVLNRYHWMYSATAYNHAYGDSGLFCIHATAPPTHVVSSSHHAGTVRDAGPTRRPGTSPRQNPTPVDAADESGSAPRRLRGHWTPSVGHRRAKTTRAFYPGDRENHRRGHPERGEAVPGLTAGTGRTRRNQGHSRRQGHPDGAGRRRGATARQPAALAVPMSSAARLRKINQPVSKR